METLADYLGMIPVPACQAEGYERFEGLSGRAFAQAILDSQEFRAYIVNALVLGELPAAVVTRLMDYAWGKPPDRLEHTGRDGLPIEMITRVVRVVVDASHEEAEAFDAPKVTH